jgi:hypothetical protein
LSKLSEPAAKVELGVSGVNTYTGQIRSDEFLSDLKGRKAVKKYREMRDNNAIIGAVMYAVEQTLRDVEIKCVPADESDVALAECEFLKSVISDMEHSLDDHITEALSFLTYGWSWHEVVYKRRGGDTNNPKKSSKYTDGRIGVKKIAIRAPWTTDKFEVDKDTGDVLGMWQSVGWGKPTAMIPASKSIYYRTTSLNNDPSGRSVLRNAYVSYTYLNKIQDYEAIAIERELHGVPIGRMPAEYLSVDANPDQTNLRNNFERILRDLKNNEQGYALLPSDLYMDADGKPTNQRLMDVELITANGSRSIDIDPVVKRYQHDIARSLMSEFLMLGTSGGSYALSKTKTDLFLRSLESYINAIVDVLNKQLVERLWQLNGLPWNTMPKLVAGDVAPHDLREIASFLRNLNGADIDVSEQPEVVEALMHIAEIPFKREEYVANLADRKAAEAKALEVPTPPPVVMTEAQKMEHELLKSLFKGD